MLSAIEAPQLTAAEHVLLAETVALRAIVISLLARVGTDRLPATEIEAVIARADGLRWTRATERWATAASQHKGQEGGD